MGFRQGAWATVWEVTPMSDTFTKCRISTSRKDRETGQYETDFSGYVAFVGTATAAKAAKLSERERIKLGDVDVTVKYVKESNKQFTNFKAFSFETQDEANGEHVAQSSTNVAGSATDDLSFVESGLEGDEEESPF